MIVPSAEAPSLSGRHRSAPSEPSATNRRSPRIRLGNALETASPSQKCQFHDLILAENKGPLQQECQKQPLTVHPTWKKGTKINTSPKTQTHRFQLSTRKILQKKKFYKHFQNSPVKIIMAPTPHYFSPATQNQPGLPHGANPSKARTHVPLRHC